MGYDDTIADESAAFAGTSHQVVAVYESHAEAEAARNHLIDAGISPDAIEVLNAGQNQGLGQGAGSASTGTTGTHQEGTHHEEGFWGSIKSLFAPDDEVHGYAEGLNRGHAIVAVHPPASSRDRVIELLESTNPLDFDERQNDWRSGGWTGTAPGTRQAGTTSMTERDVGPGGITMAGAGGDLGVGAGAVGATASRASASGTDLGRSTDYNDRLADTGSLASGVGGAGAHGGVTETGGGVRGTGRAQDLSDDGTIQVLQERLRVGKREVAGGAVRVRSYVVETPVSEEVRLRQESISLERRPVDRAVAAGDAFRERSIELTATSEEAVVGKEARVVEEIGLHKQVGERVETVTDKLRHTEVEVDDQRTGHALETRKGDPSI